MGLELVRRDSSLTIPRPVEESTEAPTGSFREQIEAVCRVSTDFYQAQTTAIREAGSQPRIPRRWRRTHAYTDEGRLPPLWYPSRVSSLSNGRETTPTEWVQLLQPPLEKGFPSEDQLWAEDHLRVRFGEKGEITGVTLGRGFKDSDPRIDAIIPREADDDIVTMTLDFGPGTPATLRISRYPRRKLRLASGWYINPNHIVINDYQLNEAETMFMPVEAEERDDVPSVRIIPIAAGAYIDALAGILACQPGLSK